MIVKRYLYFTLLSFLVFFLWAIAPISHAGHVSTNGNEGQAFLFTRAGQCYALLPEHVLNGADYAKLTVAPVLAALSPRSAQADRCYTWTKDDLALTKVSGLTREECRPIIGPSRSLRESAYPAGIGMLWRTNRNGSRSSRQVSISFIGAGETVAIRPTDSEQPLRQGDSGSTLFVDDKPSAMLINIDPQTLDGYVFDFSELDAKLVIAGRNCEWAERTSGESNSRGQFSNWRVSRWSHPPVNEDVRPEVLFTDRASDKYWLVDIGNDQKAWIEFTTTIAGSVVSGIEVSLAGVPEDVWPTNAELFTCNARGAACTQGQFEHTNDGFVARFGAPRQAGVIRIEFYKKQKAASVGISRIEIY